MGRSNPSLELNDYDCVLKNLIAGLHTSLHEVSGLDDLVAFESMGIDMGRRQAIHAQDRRCDNNAK